MQTKLFHRDLTLFAARGGGAENFKSDDAIFRRHKGVVLAIIRKGVTAPSPQPEIIAN